MNTTESEHFEEDELGPGELVVLELPDGSAVMTAVDETEPDGRQYVLSAGAVTGRGRSIAAARGGVWSTPLAASLFVLGAGRELRSPVAGGRVMGLLVQDQVLSPEGGEVLFGDVRCASQRQLLRSSSVGKSSALSTGALAAEVLEVARAAARAERVRDEARAWQRRAAYFESACREVAKRAAAVSVRTALSTSPSKLIAHQKRRALQIALRELRWRALPATPPLTNDSEANVSSTSKERSWSHSSQDTSTLSAASFSDDNEPYYTGQPLVLVDAEERGRDAPLGSEVGVVCWHINDKFGRFRPISDAAAVWQSPVYTPVADDVGKIVRGEHRECSADEPNTSGASTRPGRLVRYAHTRPIRLAPDVEREVNFRLSLIPERSPHGLRSGPQTTRAPGQKRGTAAAPPPPTESASSAAPLNGAHADVCRPLSWPGVLIITEAMRAQAAAWQVWQDRTDEVTLVFREGERVEEQRLQAASRHERDVIVSCLRAYADRMRASAARTKVSR
ncbi:hypothetical protein CDCA_CDCA09G2746 [Cyanidium caldarium]|uniref:Uncharacterized protein n=1 Tax=Cyanidium caldarium TaxID=2771 RepID=A0AAV9IX42_CYACA|nr:hypothetical protein CDCA_CDCA09G2746 [Cyanidium caldarium]